MLGYSVSLIFEEPLNKKETRSAPARGYPSGIFSLLYWRHKANLWCPPDFVPEEEDFPLYAPKVVSIPSGAQIIVNTHISFDLLSKTFLELHSPAKKTNSEPHLCPGIIKSAHTSSVQVLLANLTTFLMKNQKGQLLGYRKILKVSDLLSIHPSGGFNELNLPSEDPVNNALISNADFTHLPEAHEDQKLALLDKSSNIFADIFAEGPHEFSLAKSVIH